MTARIPVLLMCCVGATGFAEDAIPLAVKSELQRLIDAIQARKEPDLRDFVTPAHQQAVLTAIRDLQKFLREQREAPRVEAPGDRGPAHERRDRAGDRLPLGDREPALGRVVGVPVGI